MYVLDMFCGISNSTFEITHKYLANTYKSLVQNQIW